MAEYGGEEVGVAGHGGEVAAEAGALGGIDEDGEAGRCMVAVHEVELEAGVYTGCKSVTEGESVGGRSTADTG